MMKAGLIVADERVAGYAIRSRALRAFAWGLAALPVAWTMSSTARIANRVSDDLRRLEGWQRVRAIGGTLLTALATHAAIALVAGDASAPVVAAWAAMAAAGAVLVAYPRRMAAAWRKRLWLRIGRRVP